MTLTNEIIKLPKSYTIDHSSYVSHSLYVLGTYGRPDRGTNVSPLFSESFPFSE